jgi:hypothetical protein
LDPDQTQNGSKNAKYEKISCLEEPDVFSRGWGFTWRWEGIMEASTINVHKNSSKIIFFFINKLLRFFLKNYGPGSESGFSKAWIRLHNNGFWRNKLISIKHRKTYLKNSFRGIALYVVPNGRILSKHGFFLRKLDSRIVAKAKGAPTNYFIYIFPPSLSERYRRCVYSVYKQFFSQD